ncbi:DUF2863 family protein [Herbaspirillum sp. LeCh32-8]|uniref:DUF2863 family protein n=1 Tax=Herbaspirillum sp. LeCh32-8 TaxID=2821356 RepID=UPI001AE1B0BE|nr:DUF2863 family protein [Herbaspirillum sp. LeCh32-8]MBP0598909.1 DUF2863 family protein [Herbaspirillum sp. LeCh32-8]
MNKPNRPQGKPQANANQKPGQKPAAKSAAKPSPKSQGPARDKPKTHVATDASRRRQHNAHAATQVMDEGEEEILQLLALSAAVATGAPDAAGRRVGQDELERMVRNFLRQREDEILHEALEQLRDDDRRAHALLLEIVEEAADVVVLRRGEKEMEINAFLIPFLARTTGGLREAQALADGEAFDALRSSMQEAGLESAKARVVLVHHLYHPDEIDALTYGDVEAMNRDAFASLTDKKVMSVPAIERSMRGWPQSAFAAEDEALELRFLLGFALKELNDPFYAIPKDEAQADAYFARRGAAFRAWTERYTPLMQQCLTGKSGDEAQCELHFMYQDLFHGGKRTGNAEYRTLQMMSELEQGLAQADAAAATAVFAVTDEDGESVLQVLLRLDARVLAQSALVFDGDPQERLFDAADAVASLGVTQFRLADAIAEDGAATRERDFPQA